MENNTIAAEKKKASWHKALFWVELLFTLTIAWTAYMLPEISLAVSEGREASELLSFKNASIFRSGVIAIVYVFFLVSFNWAYVFFLKPKRSIFMLFLVWFPLLSLVMVFAGGYWGTVASI